MARALILACSRAKRPDPQPLRAIDRYDGPAFRVLRRHLSGSGGDDIRVAILSAEFGLIDGSTKINTYDREMTKDRASELAREVEERFVAWCDVSRPDSFMVHATGTYLFALDRCWTHLPVGTKLSRTIGGIGGQVSRLGQWLGVEPRRQGVVQSGEATVRGVTIKLGPDEIAARASEELQRDRAAASRFETWCVAVSPDHVVAPKWLVSVLTGLPVSAFRTADALTALRKLGLVVRRPSPADRREQTDGLT